MLLQDESGAGHHSGVEGIGGDAVGQAAGQRVGEVDVRPLQVQLFHAGNTGLGRSYAVSVAYETTDGLGTRCGRCDVCVRRSAAGSSSAATATACALR